MVSPVSTLANLRALLTREAPAHLSATREALQRTAQTGKEASVVGASDLPIGGRVVVGDYGAVTPSVTDRTSALMSSPQGAPVLDFHTHPAYGMAEAPELFGVRPSSDDLSYWLSSYGSKLGNGRMLKTIIAQPPSKDSRARAAYSMFVTDKPAAVFSPTTADAARFELQRAASKGAFRSVMDDPAYRDYFDYGGEMGDLLQDASPLLLLRYRAGQGLGRYEQELGGRALTPDIRSTEQRLMRMMEPEAVEVLRAKKFSRGGLAQVKQRCTCQK